VDGLAKAVQIIVVGKRGAELDELILEDELLALGGEEDVVILLAPDGESESRLVAPRDGHAVADDPGLGSIA